MATEAFYKTVNRVFAGRQIHEVEWPAHHDAGGYVECSLTFYQVDDEVWVRGYNDQDSEFVARLVGVPEQYSEENPGVDDFLEPSWPQFVDQIIKEVCGVGVDFTTYQSK